MSFRKVVAGIWFPFAAIGRAIATVAWTMVNLDGRQMRSIFSLGLLGGIVALSLQNIGLIYMARDALDAGETFLPLFEMLQGQMRFNSGLVAWFAMILGLVVFGADYFRAKLGSKSLEMGRGDPPAPPSGDRMLDGEQEVDPPAMPQGGEEGLS